LEKAYDLVNREVLWKIMEVMGYPITFTKWLKTMYSVTHMSILNGTEVAWTISDFDSFARDVQYPCTFSSFTLNHCLLDFLRLLTVSIYLVPM